MDFLFRIFRKHDNAVSKPASDARQFNYLIVMCYSSIEDAESDYNLILSKRDAVTVPSHLELRISKRGMFPNWLVFYLEHPEDFDKLSQQLGDGKFLPLQADDHDSGYTTRKYENVAKMSRLIKSVRLR